MSITSGIIFIPLDVRFGRDPKVRSLVVHYGLDGLAASALYLLMAAYCRENETDGIVPADEVGALAYPLLQDQWQRLLKALDEHDLIDALPDRSKHPPGRRSTAASSQPSSDGWAGASSMAWRVRAYVKRNGTREAHERERAQRAEAGRRGGTAPHRFAQVSAGAERPLQAPAKRAVKRPPKGAVNPETESETYIEPVANGGDNHPPAEAGTSAARARTANDEPPF